MKITNKKNIILEKSDRYLNEKGTFRNPLPAKTSNFLYSLNNDQFAYIKDGSVVSQYHTKSGEPGYKFSGGAKIVSGVLALNQSVFLGETDEMYEIDRDIYSGSDSTSPKQYDLTPVLTNVSMISVEHDLILALTHDGIVYSKCNRNFPVGREGSRLSLLPITQTEDGQELNRNIVSIATTSSSGYLLHSDRQCIYSFGSEYFGLLGHGAEREIRQPRKLNIPLDDGDKIKDIFSSNYAIFVLTETGKVFSWGAAVYNGTNAEINTPTLLTIDFGPIVEILEMHRGIVLVNTENEAFFCGNTPTLHNTPTETIPFTPVAECGLKTYFCFLKEGLKNLRKGINEYGEFMKTVPFCVNAILKNEIEGLELFHFQLGRSLFKRGTSTATTEATERYSIESILTTAGKR